MALVFFGVTCKLAPLIADLDSDSDYNPNVAAVTADVTFRAKILDGDVLKSFDASPPTMYVPVPIVGTVDSADGILKLRSTPDSGGTGTYAPVRLLGNSDSLDLDGELWYEFTFANLRIDNRPTGITIAGGAFPAPDHDTTVDLIDYMRTTGVVATGEINRIAPTEVRLDGGDIVFSFANADIPSPIPFEPSFVSTEITDAGTVGLGLVQSETAADAWEHLGVAPAENLPSYVDDVVEYANQAAFPAEGATGKIYVALDNNDSFRWSGSAYVRISDRVTASGITDSGAVGRSVVQAATTAAAQTAVGVLPTIPEPTDDNPAAVSDGFTGNSHLILTGGDYEVPLAGVTVPAGKALETTSGSSLKLADGELDSATPGLQAVVTLGSGSRFVGTVDGNRGGQDNTAFNAASAGTTSVVGVWAGGSEGSPLTGLHIDATVTGVAEYPVSLYYVNDSYVRVRASDCGGAIALSNCSNMLVDIEVDDQNNDGWKIYPHAVDFLNCSNIRGRVIIRNQSGDSTVAAGTSLSDWVSGFTVIDSDGIYLDEVDCEFTSASGQTKSLGVSFLGVRNAHVSKLRIVGYSDTLLELGGVVDSTFSGLELDGRYAKSDPLLPVSAGYGISLYNNAYRADFKGRTKEQSRNVGFFGGTIRRCLGLGVNLQAASNTTWTGVSVKGARHGLYSFYANADSSDGAAPTTGVLAGHRFHGCEFSYNERSGVLALDLKDSVFVDCVANNNCQSLTYGSTRTGLGLDTATGGFTTRAGTSKSGLQFIGCRADDTQGATLVGFPDPNRPTVVAVDKPSLYEVGQTVTLTGAGAAGADLLTRIDAITHDELTLSDAVQTVTTATLTGTIATSGTAVTGTGTTFLTDLVGRAFIKVGSDYRRVAKVASDTAATLDSAFPSDVAGGTALVIAKVSIVTAASQKYGFLLTSDTVSPVLSGPTPVGNTTSQIADSTASGTPTVYNLTTATSAVSLTEIKDRTHATRVAYFVGTSGAGNYLQFTNSNGSNPGITALGSSTNIGVTVLPKGTGAFTIYAPTGESAKIQGSGPDSDHSIDINTKGAGVARVNGAQILVSGGALGTPASGTLTNCTGLPVSGIVNGADLATRQVVSLTSSATLSATAARTYYYLLGSGADPTLPTAVGNTSLYHIKNTHTAAIDLKLTSSQTIDGGAGNLTIWPNECYTLVSNGTNWVII